MADGPSPDPRFDPRFQRGYDGPQPAPPSAPALPSPTDPVAREPVRAPEPVEPAAAAVAPALRDDAPWSPPRRNPFAIALLVGGLALIAVGGWLTWSEITASSFPNGYDEAGQALALIQQVLTPAFLIAGTLGVIGWLVLGALAAVDREPE